MTDALKRYTLEEFDKFISLPENRDRSFEFIGGEIVEVVSNSYSSTIAMLIGGAVSVFVRQNKLGRVSGADGGYMVMGEKYIPDAAFISYARQPKQSYEAYNPLPPDLAIEVLSPSNDEWEMRVKIANYLQSGTVVWLADPDRQRMEVYAPGQPVQKLGIDDVLDGGTVLPGFKLPVRDIFPQDEAGE